MVGNIFKRKRSIKKIIFEDTATIAAAGWLKAAKIDPSIIKEGWSGQWLHWPKKDFDDNETACPEVLFKKIQDAKRHPDLTTLPTYYAVLMLDGDKMGDKGCERSGIDAQRELSGIIANFASGVPGIVDTHKGTLVYAGGDDVLALLPASEALACATVLSEKFKSLWTENSGFKPATVSAGIAIVHYKQDLRFAINATKKAEQLAKSSGRNAVTLSVCRRSGAHTTVVMPWEFVSQRIQPWVSAFQDKTNGTGSDRWAYALAAELPILEGLKKIEAIKSEIKRLVKRSTASLSTELTPEIIVSAFAEYHKFCSNKLRQPQVAGFKSKPDDRQKQILLKNAIQGFVTLCQSASFLARGRDQ